jgi:transglutaminase-like putative cysteine protease
VEREEVGDDGRLTTESRLELRFRRGGVEQSIGMASRFVETAEGRPVQAWSRQSFGPSPVETTYEFLADGEGGGEVLVTTRQGSSERTERVAAPEEGWLTPGEAHEELRRRLAAGEGHFTLRTFDPLLGVTPVEVHWQRTARHVELEAAGRSHATTRWRQLLSVTPEVETVVHLDADARVVRSSTPMLGMPMTVTLASRERVLAEDGAPEILAQSLLRPDRPIRDPRHLRRAVYELTVDRDGLELPPTHGHHAVEVDGRRAKIEIDLDRPPHPADVGAEERARYLRASGYVDHHHPAVRRLLEATPVPAGATEEETARALRDRVAAHLTDKGLDLVLATAGEVAERRAGDCTEHSVLLTALLRAAGIPARVVAGLVYVDAFAGERHVFGYHMWSQALVDGRWLDLDAALETPFDATHVAFATTALDDPQADLLDLARFAPLIGRAEIRVLETGDKSGR